MPDAGIPERLMISPGSSKVVDVPGHGVGGYIWSAVVERGAGKIEELAPEAAASGFGAGAVARFRLTWLGDEPGTVTLRLTRPWEGAPIEVHHIEIVPADD